LPVAEVIPVLAIAAFTLMATVLVLISLGLRLPAWPFLVYAIVFGVVFGVINRARPIGLDRSGLHFGSPKGGYVIPWSDVGGVMALPGNLVVPARIRIGLANRGPVPSWWARRRWGVRVLPAAELEVPLGYGQSSTEVADEIRRFIDAYG
jgi:hypothetical protein